MKKNIVLGITGSIAAYKTPELIRALIKTGANIQPVVTKNGLHFTTNTLLSTLTGNTPLTDAIAFDTTAAPHLSIVPQPNILVIAPATANIIAKCAHGVADDILSTIFLSFIGPKLMVPAMHTGMYENPATQTNVKTLKKYGVQFLGPTVGDLSCGDTGLGRMVEIRLIKLKIESMFKPPIALNGKKICITAGGTSEPIDSVRVITNRASGQSGETLAHLASFYGADVILITTAKKTIDNPHIKQVTCVSTAEEMSHAVKKAMTTCDYLYMTAAVSDYTCRAAAKKITRAASRTLELNGTEDILAGICKKYPDKTHIGFCLCDTNLAESALNKLKTKGADFIVANQTDAIGNAMRTFSIYDKNNPKKPKQYQQVNLLDSAYELLKLVTSS